MLSFRPLSTTASRPSVARFLSIKIPSTVYVANIPYAAKKDELQTHFSPYGEILGLRLPLQRETGKPRGIAFVDYASPQQAAFAVESLNGTEFLGRLLLVRTEKPLPSEPTQPENDNLPQ
eukprot:TRINITY_DN12182_c0_g2_i1.p1 TRINITY_DN12182_c0_g2~~TRINITY_DN12182_c0_g2_i1.p1  ORF type:complete len:120 (+),score=9.22 TRINITY_DN12182_c0_g2_i1:72-431(+)